MKHDSGTVSSGVGAPRRKSILALIASFSLLLVGLVGVIAAPAASAHTPNAKADCQVGVSVRATSYDTKQGDSTPNNVSITVTDTTANPDVVVVSYSQNFGSNFNSGNWYETGALTPATHSFDWKVVVTAWNDPAGESGNGPKGWTKTFTGTLGACEEPPPTLSIGVTGPTSVCTPNQDGKWNVTWHVTNNSDVQVSVSGGGFGPQNIAAHGSFDFTKTVTGDVPGFNFTASKSGSTNAVAAAAGFTAPSGGCSRPAISVEVAKECVPKNSNYKITWVVTNNSGANVNITTSTGQSAVGSTTNIAPGGTATFQEFQSTADTYTGTFSASWTSGVNDKTGSASDTKTITAGDVNNCKPDTYYTEYTDQAYACIPATEGTPRHTGFFGPVTKSTTITRDYDSPLTWKQQQEAADALVKKQAEDAVNGLIEKAGGSNRGVCGWTASDSVSIQGCYRGENYGQTFYSDEQTPFVVQPVGYSQEAAAKADADAQAAAAAAATASAEGARDAWLQQNPGFTNGACPDTTTYGASRGASGSVTICTADGKTVEVKWSGSAAVSGKNSQDDANTQAQNDANKAADADKAAKLAAFPGATEGACVPPTTTSPVVAPEPAVVTPAPAKKPAAKPVAAPKPASVPAGFAGTVPAAVPAGDGSSAPQSGFPTWAMLLIVAGAAGAAFSIKRLASQR